MGLLDRLKKQAPALKDKATDLARDHGDTVGSGIEKAADLADQATKGRYTGQIDGAAGKAKDAVDGLGRPEQP